MMDSLERRIIWAIDPFDDVDRLRQQMPPVIRSLVGTGSSATGNIKPWVQPVHVLSPGTVVSSLELEFGGPWLQQFLPEADRAIHQVIDGLDIPGMVEPKILVENVASTAQAAHLLADYASEAGADFIVSCSHARKGMSRFLLGSFAETLLYQSSVPVTVVAPQDRVSNFCRRILFPTQFGARSKDVFRRVVEQARILGAKVILFHAIPQPVEPIIQSGAYLFGGAWVPVQAYFSSEIERRQRRADAWARWARNQGVVVEPIVDAEAASIADTICALAKNQRTDLIAMEARSGPVAAVLIGSMTRQVIRNADCPVVVLRALPKAEEATPPEARAAA